jgi:hypothetical protein
MDSGDATVIPSVETAVPKQTSVIGTMRQVWIRCTQRANNDQAFFTVLEQHRDEGRDLLQQMVAVSSEEIGWEAVIAQADFLQKREQLLLRQRERQWRRKKEVAALQRKHRYEISSIGAYSVNKITALNSQLESNHVSSDATTSSSNKEVPKNLIKLRSVLSRNENEVYGGRAETSHRRKRLRRINLTKIMNLFTIRQRANTSKSCIIHGSIGHDETIETGSIEASMEVHDGLYCSDQTVSMDSTATFENGINVTASTVQGYDLTLLLPIK